MYTVSADEMRHITIGQTLPIRVDSQDYTLSISRLTSSSVTLELQPGGSETLIFLEETKEIPLHRDWFLDVTLRRINVNTTQLHIFYRYTDSTPPPPQNNFEEVPQEDTYQEEIIEQEISEEPREEYPLEMDINFSGLYILGGFIGGILIFIAISVFILNQKGFLDKGIALDKNLQKNPPENIEISKITSFDEYEMLRNKLEKKF